MKRMILLAVSIIFSICSLVGCGENKSDTYLEVTSEPVATSTTDSEQKNNVVDSNSIVEDNHFNITRTEFINKYNELFDELNDDPYDDYSPFVDYPTRTYEPTEDDLLSNPNIYKIYEYNTTYVSTDWVSYLPDSYVRIFVDKDDNVIGVTISTFNDHNLRRDQAWKEFVYDECTATYMAITGETKAGTARKALDEAEFSPETGKKGSYVYGIVEYENYDKTFTIKVINQ